MISCHRKFLVARCRQRGYTLNEVRACIVSEDGGQITVDVDHPAYPRAPKPGFVPPQPQSASKPPATTHGPGTELKKLLAKVGITATCGNRRVEVDYGNIQDWMVTVCCDNPPP